jgi:hypothetical protein
MGAVLGPILDQLEFRYKIAASNAINYRVSETIVPIDIAIALANRAILDGFSFIEGHSIIACL